MTPEDQIAALKQEVADLKAERATLKRSLDDREADNKKARDKIKELEDAKAAVDALLPSKDQLVLTKDDAAAWAAYQELGKPDLLKVKLDDYTRATTEATALKRRELVDKAARDPKDETAYRFKPTVLGRILGDLQLTHGKDGYSVMVGDSEKPLEKWLEEDQADFLPALTADLIGTPALRQPGNRSGTASSLTAEQIAEQRKNDADYRSF